MYFVMTRSKLLWHTKTQILATDISKQHEILHRFQVQLVCDLIHCRLLIDMLTCCVVINSSYSGRYVYGHSSFEVITFCMSRRRRKMYCGHSRLSVCLSVCLRVSV